MKKIIIILISATLLLFSSCDDFLNIKPRNEKIVKTVDDYRDILASYMRFLKDIKARQMPVLGEVFRHPAFDISQTMGIYSGELTIKPSKIFDPKTGDLSPNSKNYLRWMAPYTSSTWNYNNNFVGALNFIIDNIDEAELTVSNNNKEEKIAQRNYVKGEALVWRAYAYYKILQLYCPYKNNDFGIVLNHQIYSDPSNYTIKRSTQRASYDFILKDCQRALDLLKATPTNQWNTAYNYDFIHAMMANIYMFKAMSGAAEQTDWTNSIKYADLAIGTRNLSNDPQNLRAMFDISTETGLKKLNHPEIILRIIKKDYFNFPSNGIAGGNYLVETEAKSSIYNSYNDQDIRKGIYFHEYGATINNNKYNNAGNTVYGGVIMPFRLADLMLIKAEALYRTNQKGLAKELLVKFQQGRYTQAQPDTGLGDELLKQILKERKLEFYLEIDMRWLEMKRLGEEFNRGKFGDEVFILKGDDFRYTLPIPKSEIRPNNEIKQNPGWNDILNL